MKARFNYRVYPTPSQQSALARLFGCTRVVWNDSLAHCLAVYRAGGKKPKNAELQKQFITLAKQTAEKAWLSEVSNIPLQQSLNDLEQAYINFFKSCKGQRIGKAVKPPRFKKRNARQSARFRRGGFKVYPEAMFLSKIGKIATVFSRPLPTEPSSVTIVKDAAERYFISCVVEVAATPLPELDNAVGIDLGISTFATLDTGEKIEAPKPLKRRLHQLRGLGKNLSRKQKGSKRYERARRRKARLYAKLKDTRTDFLHKLSTKIIHENQVVVMEDLNVSGMLKNRKLSRAISDLGWRQFRSLLVGKAEKYGRTFQIIDRWEPTSQVCSCCRFRGGKKDLAVREWVCLNCGAVHDRDINAAKNIKVAGGQSETNVPLTNLLALNLRKEREPQMKHSTINGRGGKRQTGAKSAAPSEASTPFSDLMPTEGIGRGEESSCL